MSLRREADAQYVTTNPLQVRIETHQRYSERQIDLNRLGRQALELSGSESILDVGCGPGEFIASLRTAGHRGRLVGFDRSAAMIAAAPARERDAEWLVGDVEHLPFEDAEFTRVAARHMLYYVADIAAALAELARVTSDNGVFLATTNAVETTPRISDLYLDLLLAFGCPVQRHAEGEFHTEDAVRLLSEVWNNVEETIIDNAFVFTTPEPIVRYVATLLPSVEGVDDELLAAMIAWLEREATTRLHALGGVWRDPKIVGLYICRH